MVVTSFLHPVRCTIFANLSMKTIMVVNPFDLGKSIMRSVVTFTYFLKGIVKGYNNPAFALLLDFII